MFLAPVMLFGGSSQRQRRFVLQPRIGARNERLPWDLRTNDLNPNGVASAPPRLALATPLGLARWGFFPRVARASQRSRPPSSHPIPLLLLAGLEAGTPLAFSTRTATKCMMPVK